jgi:hypothetical protein
LTSMDMMRLPPVLTFPVWHLKFELFCIYA